jgi:hypothetical protein
MNFGMSREIDWGRNDINITFVEKWVYTAKASRSSWKDGGFSSCDLPMLQNSGAAAVVLA